MRGVQGGETTAEAGRASAGRFFFSLSSAARFSSRLLFRIFLYSNLLSPLLAKNVFGLMTCFTKCLGTSFTLPRERSERGSVAFHAMADDGCPRTAR